MTMEMKDMDDETFDLWNDIRDAVISAHLDGYQGVNDGQAADNVLRGWLREAEAENERLKADLERAREYIKEHTDDVEAVTLCHVCGRPVWPPLSLWQQFDPDRNIVYGHRACFERTKAS